MADLRTVPPRVRRSLPALAGCAVCIAFSLAPLHGAAADKDKDDAPYLELVKRATGGDLSMNFRELRVACLKASTCNARGDDKDRTAMRRAMQAGDHAGVINAAVALIQQGFVNIEAHMASSSAYSALKDPDKATYHRAIASRLIRSILDSGDGKTAETAYEAIGTFEEYLVLRVLGHSGPVSQALVNAKPHSYDVLTVKDAKTGKETRVFFNIDLFFPAKGL